MRAGAGAVRRQEALTHHAVCTMKQNGAPKTIRKKPRAVAADSRRQAKVTISAASKRRLPAPAVDSSNRGRTHELERQNEQLLEVRAELETTLRQYTDLYDLVPIGYVTLRRDGTILQLNRAAVTVLGAERSQLIKRRLGGFLLPESRATLRTLLGQVFDGQQNKNCEVALLNGSEPSRWVRIDAKAFQGGRECLLALSDITERRQTQEALRDSEERYRTLADGSPFMIGVLAEQGMVYLNPAGAKLLGLERPEKMYGKVAQDLVHPDDLPVILKRTRRAEDEDRSNQMVEVRLIRPDGATVQVESVSAPIIYQGRPAIQFIARGIDEHKQVEAALRKSDQRLSSIYDTVGDAIFHLIVEAEGEYRFASVNNSFCRMTGLSKEQIIGKTVVEVIPVPSLPLALGMYRQAIRKKTVIRWEESSDYPAGRLTGEVSIAPVFDDKGRCTHLVGSVHDLSERKQAEEAVRRQADELAALNATALEIAAPHDLDGLLHMIVERATDLLGTKSGGVYLCDPVRREVRCVVSHNTQQDYTGTILKYGEGAAGVVAETGEPLIIDDYRAWDKRSTSYEEQRPFSAVLSVPMIWNSQVTGVIHVLDDVESRRFSQNDLALLTQFASYATAAVENIRLYEKAQHEIAERKQVEAALRESEADLQGVLQSAADGILAVNSENKVLHTNERFVEMWRIPQEAMATQDDTALLQHVLDQLNDPQDFLGKVRQLYKSKEESFDTLYLKDGRVFERRSRAIVHETKVRGRVWSFHDITSRVQANKVQDATYRIAQAANQTGSLDALYPAIHKIIQEVMVVDHFYIALYDEEKDLLSFPYVTDGVDSPAPPPKKPGRGLTEYVLRTGKPLLCDEALFEQLIRRGEVELVGVASPIWLGVPLIVDGKTIGVIAVQDYENAWAYGEREQQVLEFVSTQAAKAIQRKRAEEALSKAEEKYRSIFENATEAITQTTPEGRYITANPAAARMLGYESPEDLIANSTDIANQFYVQPDRRQEFIRLMEEHESISGFESEVFHKDESTRWISENAVAIRDEDGSLLYYEGTAQDITDRKRAEILQDAVYRIASATLTTASLDDLYVEIHHIISDVMHAENFYIAMYNEGRDLLRFPYFKDAADEAFLGEVHPGKGLTAYVLRTGKSLLCTQAIHNELEARGEVKLLGAPSSIWLGVPLNIQGRTIGAMVVQHYSDPTAYGEREQHILEFVSAQVAVAIERKRVEGSLKESEARFRALFEDSPISLWEQDFSLVKQRLDSLRQDGITNLEEYFEAHPEVVSECAALIGALNVNKATLAMYGAQRKEDLLKCLAELLQGKPMQHFRDELVKIAAGEISFEWEGVNNTLDGRLINVDVNWSVVPGHENDLSRVIVSLVDITERKESEQRLQQKARELQILYETSLEVSAQTSLDQLLSSIVERAASLLGTDSGGLYLVEPDGESLKLVVSTNLLQGYIGLTLKAGEGLSGKVMQSGKAMQVEDYRKWAGQADVFRSGTFRRVLAIPLRVQDRVIGVIHVSDTMYSGAFSEDEVRLGSLFADQAALAIESARLYEEERRRRKDLGTLYESALAISSNLSLDAVLRTVVEQVSAALNVDECAISFVDNARGALVTMIDYAENDLGTLDAPGTMYLMDDYPTSRRVLDSGKPLLLTESDPGADPEELALLKEDGMSAVWLLPLVVGGRVTGLMELFIREGGQPSLTEDEVRLAQSLATQTAIYIENARLFEKAERRLARTLALHRIDQAITGSTDASLILKVVLDEVVSQLDAGAAAVLLFDPTAQTLNYASGAGFHTDALRNTHLPLGQGYAGRAALERKAVHVPNLQGRKTDFLRSPTFSQEGFVSYYGIPLIAKGEIKGVLEVFHRAAFKADAEWLGFLETLSGQCAMAIDSANLFVDLQRSNIQLIMAYDATIEGWSRAMDLRDHETEGHTQRVAELAVELSRVLDYPEPGLVHLRRGALLHDLGKMAIPDNILHKPGALTDYEWVIMKQHPTLAHNMLAHIQYVQPALEIPYCHHEKWDGTGYPRGLKGEQIPFAARIFTVVDVYDALRSDRPYRQAWPEDKARKYIGSQSGLHFEPRVVEAFLKMLGDRPSL